LKLKESFSLDDIFWLPAPKGVVPEEDTLYVDLCQCVNILKEDVPLKMHFKEANEIVAAVWSLVTLEGASLSQTDQGSSRRSQ
jgi:hypothetical protein